MTERRRGPEERGAAVDAGLFAAETQRARRGGRRTPLKIFVVSLHVPILIIAIGRHQLMQTRRRRPSRRWWMGWCRVGRRRNHHKDTAITKGADVWIMHQEIS